MKTDAPAAHDVKADLPRDPANPDGPTEASAGEGGVVAVRSAVEATLRRTSIPDAERIRVAIRGRDVMLTGRVHSWEDRHLARRSVRGMPGVRNVIDLMTLVR